MGQSRSSVVHLDAKEVRCQEVHRNLEISKVRCPVQNIVKRATGYLERCDRSHYPENLQLATADGCSKHCQAGHGLLEAL